MQTNQEEIPYYLQFEEFFERYYRPGDAYRIYWDSNEDRYYKFSEHTGIYEPMVRQELYRIIREFFDAQENKRISISHLKMIECCLQPMIMNNEWNIHLFEDMQDTIYECLDNGVLNLTTKEKTQYAAEYRFRNKIPRNFDWSVEYELSDEHKKLWSKLLSAIDKPEQFVNFLVCMVHHFYENEQFVLMYGPRGTGKSTILSIPQNIFGSRNCSSASIYQIGSRFGLSSIYRKRVNVNPDMPTHQISPIIASTLKLLTGGVDGSDGMLQIEFKGKTPFEAKVQTFLFFGINQLPAFSEHVFSETESIARRTILIHANEVLERDPEFKKAILDPLFLDQIYSWLVYQKPKLTILDDGETWISDTLAEWYLDSDPLLRIIKSLYKYTEKTSIFSVTAVFRRIRDALEKENLPIPKNLQAQITSKLKSLKIFRSKSHSHPNYQHIMSVEEGEIG